MVRRPLSMLVVLAACGDDGTGTPPPTGETAIAVSHYDYRFDVASRRAHSTVTAKVEADGDCTTIAFRASDLAEDAVLVDGEPAVSVDLDAAKGQLHVCGLGRTAGSAITIETDQTVALGTISTSQVGYSLTDDRDLNSLAYMVSWVGGCDKFGPCDSRPSQFATYTFHVTHDAAQAVKCSGAISEPSETETTCDFTFPGGPTYSTFGLLAYPRAAWNRVTDEGTWGAKAKVTLYDRSTTLITGAVDAAYHGGFVAKMESLFGPYPFGDELRLVIAPTYWAGFEHPGNIVLDDALTAKTPIGPGYTNQIAHTIDHEIAHQWAGDQTTLADTYDFTWKESMAEYMAYLYEDEVSAAVGARTAGTWKAYAVGAKYFPVPDEHPALFDYYGDAYGPGPMVLFRQIEALTSREVVIDALQMLLGTQRAISIADVVAALEASSGLDLQAYAAAWIHGTGAPVWPQVKLTLTPTSLRVEQTVAPERRCKFHVRLRGAEMTDVLDVPVDTFRDGVDQTLTIAPSFSVTATQVDPTNECLITVAP